MAETASIHTIFNFMSRALKHLLRFRFNCCNVHAIGVFRSQTGMPKHYFVLDIKNKDGIMSNKQDVVSSSHLIFLHLIRFFCWERSHPKTDKHFISRFEGAPTCWQTM